MIKWLTEAAESQVPSEWLGMALQQLAATFRRLDRITWHNDLIFAGYPDREGRRQTHVKDNRVERHGFSC